MCAPECTCSTRRVRKAQRDRGPWFLKHCMGCGRHFHSYNRRISCPRCRREGR